MTNHNIKVNLYVSHKRLHGKRLHYPRAIRVRNQLHKRKTKSVRNRSPNKRVRNRSPRSARGAPRLRASGALPRIKVSGTVLAEAVQHGVTTVSCGSDGGPPASHVSATAVTAWIRAAGRNHSPTRTRCAIDSPLDVAGTDRSHGKGSRAAPTSSARVTIAMPSALAQKFRTLAQPPSSGSYPPASLPSFPSTPKTCR